MQNSLSGRINCGIESACWWQVTETMYIYILCFLSFSTFLINVSDISHHSFHNRQRPFKTAHPELHIINEVITYNIRKKQEINLYEGIVNYLSSILILVQ